MRTTFLTKSILLLSLLLLTACNIQNSMLYYPGKHVPSEDTLSAHNIRFWPEGANDYRGFISINPKDAIKGTIVIFHGNAGTAADRAYYVNYLAPLGYQVLLAEYPGYGARKGKLGERSFVSDAKETVRIAYEKYGKPVFLLGESLGCGVAAATVKDNSIPIDGIILITPWDTLVSIAKEKFSWLPVRLLLTDTYDNIENLKMFPGKIAIIGAEQDEIIPIHHAHTLYASISGDKKMWIIRRAGHNDWPDAVDVSWWNEITDFMRGKNK